MSNNENVKQTLAKAVSFVSDNKKGVKSSGTKIGNTKRTISVKQIVPFSL